MTRAPFNRLYSYERAAQLERRRLKAKLYRLQKRAERDGMPFDGTPDNREGVSTGYIAGLRDARLAL